VFGHVDIESFKIYHIHVFIYRKDRLNNLLFLSPSLCTNGLSYLDKETQPKQCINDAKLKSGIIDLKQSKHQLLHRIASVKTPLTSIVFKDIVHQDKFTIHKVKSFSHKDG